MGAAVKVIMGKTLTANVCENGGSSSGQPARGPGASLSSAAGIPDAQLGAREPETAPDTLRNHKTEVRKGEIKSKKAENSLGK